MGMNECEYRIIAGGGMTHWYDCGDPSRECNNCCPYCMYRDKCPAVCEKANVEEGNNEMYS